jgi:hypothetical protein
LSTPDRDSPEVTVYHLDERDVIVDVNAAWNAFALQNGGILLADDVIGEKLLRFVTGEPTRMYLNTVLEGVRALGRSVVRPYRCDSPGLKRFMQMSVVPERGKRLRLEHRCVRVEGRDPAVAFEYRPGQTAVRCCSICNRIEQRGEWIEAAARITGTRFARLDVAYAVCANCLMTVGSERTVSGDA